jgi:hypothetical protein
MSKETANDFVEALRMLAKVRSVAALHKDPRRNPGVGADVVYARIDATVYMRLSFVPPYRSPTTRRWRRQRWCRIRRR